MLEENYCMGRKRSGSKYTEHRDDARRSEVAVIGAGPSGCMAAAAAARGGLQTLLFDANDKVGRKIYATGNGRCNLTNLHMDNNCYHIGGREDLSAFFARFCVEDNIRFWESEMSIRGPIRLPRSRKLLKKCFARRVLSSCRSAECAASAGTGRERTAAFSLKHRTARAVLPEK